MKTKYVILLVLFYNLTIGQEIKNTNYISGTINVPILIDQFLSEDHLVDDRRDSNTTYENVSGDIYTQLKNTPIHFNNNGSFSGVFKEEIYDLITEISISGSIDTEKNMGSITVCQKETKNVKAHPMSVCDYNYEYSYTYEYKNLHVSKGFEFGRNLKDNVVPYLFKPNENTTLTVSNYKYSVDEKCPKRNFSKEFLFKNIKQDYLKEKLTQKYGSYFYFNVYWDGTFIEKKEDALGIAFFEQPNAATIDLETFTTMSGKKITQGENNSSVYMEEIKYNLMDNNLRIVERALLEKLLGEINLGSSELADPAARVEAGKITIAGFYILGSFTRDKIKNTFNLRVIYNETGEIVFAKTLSFIDFIDVDKVKILEPELSQVIKNFAKKRNLSVFKN
ncbi:hypothetical protein [Lutibacter maritimus]|uniref:Uncharacterized protein n=1 Tax=Lutibacter maritimus TaxID=593133 RepID=A0A1I6S0A3_9FLAO|nr:hypothetical protein [Lutibacter maritimus]SFS70393.1 hypothetical protein SAMN04488006_2702 [Lutibacter maritimus]